jgi:hypothetical protein
MLAGYRILNFSAALIASEEVSNWEQAPVWFPSLAREFIHSFVY